MFSDERYPCDEASLAEAEEFVQGIADAINGGRPEAFADAINIPALANETMKGLDLPGGDTEEARRGFQDGTREGLPSNISKSLVDVSYTLLDVRVSEGRPTALCRVLNESGTPNYHELYLRRDGAGQWSIEDIYIALAGQKLSELMRSIVLAAGPRQRSFSDRMQGKNDAARERLLRIQEVSTAVRTDNAAGAIDLFHALPEDLQKERTVLLQLVLAAHATEDEEKLLDATERYEREFPGDPSLPLVCLDSAWINEDWDRANELLDQLYAYSEDPYVLYLKGSIHYQAGESREAKKLFLQAVEGGCGLFVARAELALFHMEDQEWDEAIVQLDAIHEQGESEHLLSLREFPEFQAFLATPEGKAWLKGLDEVP